MTDYSGPPFQVLLVEDDPGDAHLTRIAFRDTRLPVALAHVGDGVAALEYLRDPSKARPHLILLDLNMPRMSGREFLGEFKADAALADIPVVILTTSDIQTDVLSSYRLGAAGFVTKPMDIEQFSAAILKLGSYWFSLVRLPERRA